MDNYCPPKEENKMPLVVSMPAQGIVKHVMVTRNWKQIWGT